MLLSIPTAIMQTRNIRIIPTLNPESVNAYSKATKARQYLRSKTKGRAIARSYKTLVAIAKAHGIATLEEFGQTDAYDKEKAYFDPRAAIEPIRKLGELVTAHRDNIKNADAVLEDLIEVREVLEEISSMGGRFCFMISASF
jgi:hypothetical protein